VRAPLAWIVAVVITGCRDDAAVEQQRVEPEPELAEPAPQLAEPPAEIEPPAPDPVAPFSLRTEVTTTVSGEGEGPYRFTAWWHKSRADE